MIKRVVLFSTAACLILPAAAAAQQPAYVTANPYLGDTISSFDSRVSPYSPYGARNEFTTQGGLIYAQDGQYLGRLNANPYDPESVANPYGTYGSPYSPNSINNQYGQYGSDYSPLSARNPYSTTPPVVTYGEPQRPQLRAPLQSTEPRYCNPYVQRCGR